MKVLCINPPYRVKVVREGRCQHESAIWDTLYPPLGLTTVAAVVREGGAEAQVMDAVAREMDQALCLEESAWSVADSAAAERYHVVDLASGSVTRLGSNLQAYRDAEYHDLLTRAGFSGIRRFDSLEGDATPAPGQEALFVLCAER